MITGKQINDARGLSRECEITLAEALSLILESERNEILKKAFLVSDSDNYPTALEAIAIALGIEDKGRGI